MIVPCVNNNSKGCPFYSNNNQCEFFKYWVDNRYWYDKDDKDWNDKIYTTTQILSSNKQAILNCKDNHWLIKKAVKYKLNNICPLIIGIGKQHDSPLC